MGCYPTAALIIAVGVVAAQAQPSFEVASIKPSRSSDTRMAFNMQTPGRFGAANVTVRRLIEVAYNIKDFQLTGGPSWIGSDRFDIVATPGARASDQLLPMLQSLLMDRFKLIAHKETKKVPIYALVVAKHGPKLAEPNAPAQRNASSAPYRPGMVVVRRGLLVAQAAPVTALLNPLSNILGRTVVDRTAITGKYDLRLQWTPDENQIAMLSAMGVPEGFGAPPPDPSVSPSLFTALQEQLGLKLESRKAPGEILVIERVEKPSEN
jgi:bla regulator protein blaR1